MEGVPLDGRSRRLLEEMEDSRAAQLARESRTAEEEAQRGAPGRSTDGNGGGAASSSSSSSRYWAGGGEGRVAGGMFMPREPYNMVKTLKVMDLDTANFWSYAHSWQGKFGLTGQVAEGEDPRVRCMVTEANPAVILMELFSVSTFNMLDPVIGCDIGAMQDAVNECLLHRSRHHKNYPLGYVLQGAGPHFCPGGNHHPVNPPGATAFSNSTLVTSLWNVRFRELAIPGITAISGSAVGGGVAIAVNTTQRVAASNASMAFGNLSRGASPLMWLSKNLVEEVGMAGAVGLYLTDGTVSAYGGLKAGLIMGVSPTIATAKNRAMMLSKLIAQSSPARLTSHQLPDLNTHRFAQEATGFTYNMRNGAMFANVQGKAKKGAAHELAAVQPSTKKKAAVTSEGGGGPPGAAEGPRRKRQGQPRPFAARIGTQPIPVASCDAPCSQCGGRGMDGTIYGDEFYCEACWPRMGLGAAAAAPNPQVVGTIQERHKAKMVCKTCGAATHRGQWGFGVYSSDFYCGPCWRSWRQTSGARLDLLGAGFFTDVSTDLTDGERDSGTDGTVIDSGCVTASDGSDMER